MKNRIITIIICMIVVFAPACVYADVVDEPGDRFYSKYVEYMVPVERMFIANGEDGFAQISKEPGAKNATGTLENGERVYIEYACLYRGDYWGLVYAEAGYGWVKTGEFLVVYDSSAFKGEFGDEFYSYEGDLEEIYEAGSVYLWEWPGCGETPYPFEVFEGDSFSVSTAYKDEYGNEWGVLNYFGRSSWVCVSDPMNNDLPARDPMPAPAPWTPIYEYVDIDSATGIGGGGASKTLTLVVVVIIVAAVVVCTILLIKRFYKPKEKASGQDSVDKKA